MGTRPAGDGADEEQLFLEKIHCLNPNYTINPKP
jgi:hypothetical protein